MELPVIVRSVTSVPSSSVRRFVIHSLSKPVLSVPSSCLQFMHNAFYFIFHFQRFVRIVNMCKKFLAPPGKRPVFLDAHDVLKQGNSLSNIHIALEVFGNGNSREGVFPFDLGLGFDEGELIFPPRSRQLSDYFSCGGEGGGVFLILTYTKSII